MIVRAMRRLRRSKHITGSGGKHCCLASLTGRTGWDQAAATTVAMEGGLPPTTVSDDSCIHSPRNVHSVLRRRDRPVPIPAPGVQLVNLSHVEDLAEMMAAVPGNPAAVKQHFNLASDRFITLDGG